MTPTIIILALIAAFLGLRLYSVLGTRDGHEPDSLPAPRDDRAQPAPVIQTSRVPAPVADAARPADVPQDVALVYDPAAEIGIRALLAADRNFNVGRFLGGAQAAYRMILEAFWAGDRDTLRDLCDADSYAAFDTALTAREAAGQRLENRLIGIESARITNADLRGNEARIIVQFVADIAAVTRDADGNVVAGSMTDAIAADDRWSFRRNLASADPNWVLDETDAA